MMQEQEIQQETRSRKGAVQVIPAPTPAEAPAWNPAAWRNPGWNPTWGGLTPAPTVSAPAPTVAATVPPPAPSAPLVPTAALLRPAWRGNVHGPKCDIADEGAEFVCQVELPGVCAEDIEVVSFERALLVDAPRGAAAGDHGGVVLQAERAAGVPVRRTIGLPAPVRPSAVTATLCDGVLTVRLPKADPTEGPWRIDVSG